MRISAIKPQTKRPGRVSVFIDGRYRLSLSAEQAMEAELAVGKEVTQEEVKRLEKLSIQGRLINRVYRWLARRMRSEREIDEYLNRYSSDPELNKQIKRKLREQGYIDDRKFAAAWVRTKDALRPVSDHRLRFQLRAKGVNDEIISHILATARIVRLVDNKRRLARYQDRQKLIAYLARQGFSWEDIRQTLQEID